MTDFKRKRAGQPLSGLTPEEQDLWDHASRTMKPLRKAKARLLDGNDGAALEPVLVAAKKRARPGLDGLVGLPGLPERPTAVAKPSPKTTPELAAFDRKSAKRLRAGHIEIEARLDLHGMYQAEAHGALRRFLLSWHAQGAKWVLIITGKGAPVRSGWFNDDGHSRHRFAEDDFMRAEPRGILRRNVPRWLAEPDLRMIVVSYTEAAITHGGEGALYVQLRKRG